MLSLAEAIQRLLATAEPVPELETLPTAQALGRVLAADVASMLDVPPADNTAMDGYALRASDAGAELLVSQRVPAGHWPSALQVGTAARVFTGATMPPGADAVVMSLDHYESIMETMHLLATPANAAHLAESIAQHKAGKASRRELAKD